jgi:Protein of unknown function (DUF3071)
VSDDRIVLNVQGLNPEQDALVLIDADGEEFSLNVDEATSVIASRSPARTASRYAAATDGPGRNRSKETSMAQTDTLAPREIQARIRAGASIDDVINESSMDRERVERYAGPMLAERSHVAGLARGTEIRRDMASDVALSRAVGERLTPMGLEEAAADWDAWRREDGRWVVRIAYTYGRDQRRGHWVFDPRAGSIIADDAEARWLIDPSAPEPAAEDRATKPRLASVVSFTAVATDDDLPEEGAGDQDSEVVETTSATSLTSVEALADPLDVEDEAVAALHVLEQSSQQPEGGTDEVIVLAGQVQATLDDLVDDDDESPKSRPATKRKGRASVPSWDDIVFGSRKPQE